MSVGTTASAGGGLAARLKLFAQECPRLYACSLEGNASGT
nr:MAG TPA: hypothetical protein [Caudoviricetes sp.]